MRRFHQTHRRRAGRRCVWRHCCWAPPRSGAAYIFQAGGEVVGYYAGWAAYQGYTPDQLPAEHLTQINYAFAQIDPDTLTIALEDPGPRPRRTWLPCGSCGSRTGI